jgi:transposase-like protein
VAACSHRIPARSQNSSWNLSGLPNIVSAVRPFASVGRELISMNLGELILFARAFPRIARRELDLIFADPDAGRDLSAIAEIRRVLAPQHPAISEACDKAWKAVWEWTRIDSYSDECGCD